LAAVLTQGGVRVGIAGYGGRGEEQLDALRGGRHPWSIVGIADRSSIAYGRLQAGYYGERIPVVRRAADLLAFEPDVVLVSTTAAGHVPVALELIEAGFGGAVLIEKPLASNLAAARGLRETTEAWRGSAAVDFQRRCSRMYAETAALLASGELGAVRSMRYSTKKREMLSMKASHHIDLAGWLADARPTRVAATLAPESDVDRRGAFYVDPPGVVDVTYESGATLRIDTTGAGEKPGLAVECEHGSVTVDRREAEVVVRSSEGKRAIPTDAGDGNRNAIWFESTLRALAVGEDGLRPCTVSEAVDELEVLAGAFVSSGRGGEPVGLPLAPDHAAFELRIA
jgi:predicted dehydrogenase